MINLKQKLNQFTLLLKSLKPHQYGLIVAGFATLSIVSYSVSFFLPKNVTYNYSAHQTCFFNPTFLPNTIKKSSGDGISLSTASSFSVAGYPLFSKNSCVDIASFKDSVQTGKFYPLGNNLIGQTIRVSLPETPSAYAVTKTDKPTSTIGKIELNLSQPDATFSYRIIQKDTQNACQLNADKLACELAPLKLKQSKSYDLEIQQTLNEQIIGTVQKLSIKTVDPITITSQTIEQNALVKSVPKAITLTTNKQLTGFEGVTLTNDNTKKDVAINTEVSANKLTVNFAEPLERGTKFILKINKLTSEDEALLASVYQTTFTTSAGPKVTYANISAYGETLNKNFVLNFDTKLLPDQNLAKFISLNGPKGALRFSANISGSSVIITPIDNLGKCQNFSINLASGLKNEFGVGGANAWSFSSRTLCQEVTSIGYSVQGRSITAYKFGSGANKYIFVGATHGDEYGSKYLLDSWVNDLEANYPSIPKNVTVYVIPLLNPDGFAKGTRTNANNVDLNRNFPANNWKAKVKMPNGTTLGTGGGTTSLSEPESSAIASFVLAQSPKLVLTYHSQGSMVIANESGNSVSLANLYGANSGYWARADSELGETFAYDTTGAFENWLHDKHSIPALLIELSSHYGNEFYRNKSAMWTMIK